MNTDKQGRKRMPVWQRTIFSLFGLFAAIIILEIGLNIGGFLMLSMQEIKNLQSIKEKGTFRIMCLGESTTQNQYPYYLGKILDQRNLGIKFRVIDKGLQGANTAVIVSQLETNLDKYEPSLVITMMGCNDGNVMYYKDIPEADKRIFKDCKVYRFGRLIYMHISNKLKKKGIYGMDRAGPQIKNNSEKAKPVADKALYFSDSSSASAIKVKPDNYYKCLELGRIYWDKTKFSNPEQVFKRELEINPRNDYAYTGLGWIYRGQMRYAEAEEPFKKALEINPRNDYAYAGLSRVYRDQHKLNEAEETYNKALESNPKNADAYRQVGQLYRDRGRIDKAKDAYEKALEIDPRDDLAWAGLATIYQELGSDKFSKAYAEKVSSLRERQYNPVTVNNYRVLKQILDKRRIKLVCVQYPMLSIKPLKGIFGGQEDGVIFVDNEKIFRDAVAKRGYKTYFEDMFGGNFGHCTRWGNILLAENISNVILKEVFGKSAK